MLPTVCQACGGRIEPSPAKRRRFANPNVCRECACVGEEPEVVAAAEDDSAVTLDSVGAWPYEQFREVI